jgi:hypothetical protein
MRLSAGPLHLRRELHAAPAVQHGVLRVTPVAAVTTLAVRGRYFTLRLTLAQPAHVRLATLAGERRISIHRPVRTALICLGALVALAAGPVLSRLLGVLAYSGERPRAV